MSPIDRHGTTDRRNEQDETVLVLTDGSKRAERVAEWGLVFTEATSAVIHRIDVIECLDSGVIIHRHDGCVQDGCDQLRRPPTSATTDCLVSWTQRCEPAIDVLHGIPHEAILEYVMMNAIDRIIVSVRDRTHLEQSLLGRAFATVSQAATVPVMTIDGTDERYDLQCNDTDATTIGSRRAEKQGLDSQLKTDKYTDSVTHPNRSKQCAVHPLLFSIGPGSSHFD